LAKLARPAAATGCAAAPVGGMADRYSYAFAAGFALANIRKRGSIAPLPPCGHVLAWSSFGDHIRITVTLREVIGAEW